ncbi:hypothetical protein predicted by Glimmer/Critica [Sorangium cellulosum So ce56]|uniref:Uncharacterized protein n=1 Tax=Sorangium cellulosum (strain So ce56) TaxID=448385 RepID=A9FBB4_SORC5|nr:hypothetical protein predicted by Glimmer/Critica [Sorangium cellulosum So ce56]
MKLLHLEVVDGDTLTGLADGHYPRPRPRTLKYAIAASELPCAYPTSLCPERVLDCRADALCLAVIVFKYDFDHGLIGRYESAHDPS